MVESRLTNHDSRFVGTADFAEGNSESSILNPESWILNPDA